MYRSWIELYPHLDWAFTSGSSLFSLEGVKLTREGRIGDFSPPPIVLHFSWGGGGALFTGARVFARSYGQK